MTVLSDVTIKNLLKNKKSKFDISPLKMENIQPSSVDFRIGSNALVFDDTNGLVRVNINENNPLRIYPNEFLLVDTYETLTMTKDLSAKVYGKSSLGRVGLGVSLSGYIDPAFKGKVTLQLKNNNKDRAIDIYAGMEICQLEFTKLDKPAEVDYDTKADSSYQDSDTVVPSKYDNGSKIISIKR